MANTYFSSLPNMTEVINVDSGVNVLSYTMNFTNIENAVLYYYDLVTLILTELPSSYYVIDNDKKIITITNNTFQIPDQFILTLQPVKTFYDTLSGFSFPDFSFLENLSVPIFNNGYLPNYQIAPLYNNVAINTIELLYSLDIYSIGQDNSLLTGVNGEPYSSIVNNPGYSDFFAWFNDQLIAANNLYTYYFNFITSLNNFIIDNTIIGLPKPPTVNANMIAIAMMGDQFSITLQNIIKPLYQYQVDYYNANNQIIINQYADSKNAIDNVFYFTWEITDTIPVNSVVPIGSYAPVFDSVSERYNFGGVNQGGITYNKISDVAFQNGLSYNQWKDYGSSGGSNDLLFHHLITPTTTYTAVTVSTTNVSLSGLQTISGYNLTDGDLIITTGQSIKSQNGPWIAHTLNWSRPPWFSSGSISNYGGINFEIQQGSFINTKWELVTDNSITVDTTDLSVVNVAILQDSALRIYAPRLITDNALISPPAAPNKNTVYIVATGAIGTWIGQDNKFAYSNDSGVNWYFFSPLNGQIILVNFGINAGLYYQYNGLSWNNISYTINSDSDALSLSYQFDVFAYSALQNYAPLVSALNKIFFDYTTYVGPPPITELSAINGISAQDQSTYTIVIGMLNTLIEAISGTKPDVWDLYYLSINEPLSMRYSYYVINTKKPYYLKNNELIILYGNSNLFFGDYYNMVINPELYIIGQNGESYSVLSHNAEYQGFINWYSTMSSYVNSNIVLLEYNLNYLLDYATQQNINYDYQHYNNVFIYEPQNISYNIEVLNSLFNTIVPFTEQAAIVQQLNNLLFDNMVAEYKNILLSLRIHPLCIGEIDLQLPPIPTDFSTLKNYSLVIQYNTQKNKWEFGWGAVIDNSSYSSGYNNYLLSLCNMKGTPESIKQQIISLFDMTTKEKYIQQFEYFAPGSIRNFLEAPSANWHLCDGSVFDKRLNLDLYNNLVDNVIVTAVQGSNEYYVQERSKKYLFENSIAIFSSDGIFDNCLVQNYDSMANILTLSQNSIFTGTFTLQYINFLGAKISPISNNNFFLPLINESVAGVVANDNEYGFFSGSNEIQMQPLQMPKISVAYQNNITGSSEEYDSGGSFLTIQYKNFYNEYLSKPALTNIDVRQESVAINKFFIKIS